jgi:hypothetical protein
MIAPFDGDAAANARRVSIALAVLMVCQALLGRLMPEAYVDSAWIRATWIGNDSITLAVATPAMVGGLYLAAKGSRRGFLLWMSGLAYAAYNYCFYLFGAALNIFFPLYCLALVLALAGLILGLAAARPDKMAAAFSRRLPARLIGAFLVFTAFGLAVIWLAMWAAYAFLGRPTPVETEAFQVVAALDLALMVPALGVGGVLLWMRDPWGYLIAPIASIQAALYLLVLSVNAMILIHIGLAEAPGELPIWLPLLAGTSAAALTLLVSAGPTVEEQGD